MRDRLSPKSRVPRSLKPFSILGARSKNAARCWSNGVHVHVKPWNPRAPNFFYRGSLEAWTLNTFGSLLTDSKMLAFNY